MSMPLIVDDDRIACLNLKSLLVDIGLSEEDICYLNFPLQAVELLSSNQYDLLFLDLEMPAMTGFELLDAVKESYHGAVICTTVHDQYILRALRARALDYLLKPVQPDELKEALVRYWENRQQSEKNFLRLADYGLTTRQIEITRRVFEGKTSAEIAEELFLSKHTVDTHRRNILRQTGCKSTTELFRLI